MKRTLLGGPDGACKDGLTQSQTAMATRELSVIEINAPGFKIVGNAFQIRTPVFFNPKRTRPRHNYAVGAAPDLAA